MSEKTYKVKGDHLNALGEAAGIIVAFLETIKADDALLHFSAAQALQKLKPSNEPAKSMPATLLQAVDDHAERAMANLEHAHAVCKCKHGRTVATTCKGNCHTRKGTDKAEKTPTMRQLAEELGVPYKKVKDYAYKNDLGIKKRGPRGNLTRELFQADVDAIRERFG